MPEAVTRQILGRKQAQARATLKKELKMSNNNHLKRAMLLTGLVAGFGIAKPASAMLVFDPVTEGATTVTAGATTTTAVFTGIIMLKVKHMDNTLSHMSGTLDHISGQTDVIVGHQANIDNYTDNISYLTTKNYNTKNVSNITNNYYGDDNGIIPILQNGNFLGNNAENYKGDYSSVEAYQGQTADVGTLQAAAVNASMNQKTANDLLVDAMSQQRSSLQNEAGQINSMANTATTSGMGANQILMNSNALAAAQATQMVEMRSLMLAQANAQAAAQQAALDKDARHIASAQSLRAGLNVVNTSANPASGAN
jgi:hypothetical protein